MAWTNSPVHNEVGHLPAGLSHWKHGNFILYRANPPLIRMLAAVPVLFANPETDWSLVDQGPYARSEFGTGARFANINSDRVLWLFTLARWACIPLSFVGAWACYSWSRDLFGSQAALGSLTLWCFCPFVLGWGATIIPDLGCAAFGVAACYAFWGWLRAPSIWRVAAAGVLLGLAQLTKFTWIPLFLVWPTCWAWRRWSIWRVGPVERETSVPSALGMAGMLAIAVYTVNCGYAFEGCGRRLGDFEFVSQSLGGKNAHEFPDNRFRDTMLADIPVLLPKEYVQGLDVLKHVFERKMWSYLNGEFKRGGWWYFYLYGLAVKLPGATLLLFALSLFLAVRFRSYRVDGSAEATVLLPAIVVLGLLGSQTAFNHHIRYAIPALPFLYISIGRVFAAQGRNRLRFVVLLLLVASVGESLSVVPHSQSFFNFVSGGPSQGHLHLLDSNIDWGQDLRHLGNWQKEHPEATPLYTDVFSIIPLEAAEIDALPIPTENVILPPGWYAISVNALYGYGHYEVVAKNQFFRTRKPDDFVGYSIYLYRITANQPAE